MRKNGTKSNIACAQPSESKRGGERKLKTQKKQVFMRSE
jgi:hypothetical protein